MKRRKKRKNFFLDDDHISFLFTLKWDEHLKSIRFFDFLLDDSSMDEQEKIDLLYSFGVEIDELDEENLEKLEILRDLHYEILFDEPVKN